MGPWKRAVPSLSAVPGAWGPARRVVIKVEVGGGGAADVGIAAVGIVLDGLGRVEREEGEGRAGGLLRALHLQDYSKVIF
jgi:hypothetical protein